MTSPPWRLLGRGIICSGSNTDTVDKAVFDTALHMVVVEDGEPARRTARSARSAVSPQPSRSRSSRRTSEEIRSPLRQVPLADPRSLSAHSARPGFCAVAVETGPWTVSCFSLR